MLRSAITFVFAVLAAETVRAQGDLSSANNVTNLEGTWSSNVAVSTGGVSDFYMILPSTWVVNAFNRKSAGEAATIEEGRRGQI